MAGSRIRLLPPAGPGDGLEVRVSDGGTGIAPELEGRIFESGFTTKMRGKGSGLGLPIARRLMRGCGGDVVLVPVGAVGRSSWAGAELAVVVPVARFEP